MPAARQYVRPYIEVGKSVVYKPESRPDIAITVQVVAVLSSDVVVIGYRGGQREPVRPRELWPAPDEGVDGDAKTRLKKPRKRGQARLTVQQLVELLRKHGVDEGAEKTQALLKKHGMG